MASADGWRMQAARNIVIYEEDALTRALLQDWLGGLGFRLHFADHRNAVIRVPCDLVIASVYMPKRTGADCVRDIQAAHPGAPLIAISGQFRPGLAASGTTAQVLGVQQVVAKPLSRHELLGAVRGIIEGLP
jgi:CheY-like chemotaxis protein